MPDRMSSLLSTIGGVGVHGDRVAQRHGVEPADAPRAPGHGPELAATLGDALADVVEQLGRERPGAHPRGVGLHHADDLVDLERADPAAGARAARDRVGRGHVRVAAVVEVEQRALRALEQDVVAAPERVLDEPRRVVEVRRRGATPHAAACSTSASTVEARRAHRLEQQVLVRQRAADPLAQHLAVAQVLHPEPEAPGAVAVGRPDAATGRARPCRRRGGPRWPYRGPRGTA